MENFLSLPPSAREAILNAPALEAPGDLKSNFDNPPNNDRGAIVLLTVCTSLVVILGVLRLYSRVFVIKSMKVEDYLGLLAFGPYAGCIWVLVRYIQLGGVMVHQWDIPRKYLFELLKVLLVLRITYGLEMILVKTAILIEWTRIFVPRGTRNTYYWSSVAIIVLNLLVYTLGIILSVVSCIPTHKIWQPWVEGRCFNRKALDNTTAWTNLIVDLFILILPQRTIWKLQMNRSRKIGISIIFSIGLTIVACATGRIHSNMTLDYNGDTSYDACINTIWAFAEMTGVLVVFCAPAVPKALSGQGFLTGFVATLRSWSQLSDSSGPRGSKGQTSANSGRTRETASSGLDRKAKPWLGDGHGYESQAGIYRMVELDHQEEIVAKTSGDPIIERQHPWRE
jgi:hypothetical protein